MRLWNVSPARTQTTLRPGCRPLAASSKAMFNWKLMTGVAGRPWGSAMTGRPCSRKVIMERSAGQTRMWITTRSLAQWHMWSESLLAIVSPRAVPKFRPRHAVAMASWTSTGNRCRHYSGSPQATSSIRRQSRLTRSSLPTLLPQDNNPSPCPLVVLLLHTHTCQSHHKVLTRLTGVSLTLVCCRPLFCTDPCVSQDASDVVCNGGNAARV